MSTSWAGVLGGGYRAYSLTDVLMAVVLVARDADHAWGQIAPTMYHYTTYEYVNYVCGQCCQTSEIRGSKPRARRRVSETNRLCRGVGDRPPSTLVRRESMQTSPSHPGFASSRRSRASRRSRRACSSSDYRSSTQPISD